MDKPKLLLCLAFFLTIGYFTVHAQEPAEITFRSKSYNFNTISEDGDLQTCEFIFTNRGKKAIAVARVQSTCGCAAANYTRQPIAPGKQGVIKITYNPQGRPGKFKRSVFVYFDGLQGRTQLDISGTVTPGKKRKDKRFPYVIGDMQLRTNRVRFTPMRTGEQQKSILVINSGTKTLRLKCTSADPALSGSLQPALLEPGMTGEIQITRKADALKTQEKTVKVQEREGCSQEGIVCIHLM